MSIVLVGSTSGSVTLQEPAVAGSTVLTLPAVTGTVLTTTSPKAGNVIQVVSATYSTETTNSTTTYADTGLSASITPTSSSSKILVLVTIAGCQKSSGSSSNGLDLKLLRGSTDLITFTRYGGWTGTALNLTFGNNSTEYLDSPATTSSTTYKVQFRNETGSALVKVQDTSSTSTMVLLEIAA
jgi:hypothetical protein